MIGTSSSSSISKTTKFANKINLFTLTNTFSTSSLENVYDVSTSYNFIVVSFTSPKPNLLYIEYDIRFMLAPKSQRALLKKWDPIEHEIIKWPRYFNFGGSFPYKIALHSSFSITISNSSNFFLFDKICFMNLT